MKLSKKKQAKAEGPQDASQEPALPVTHETSERYYEVNEDLRSLFQDTGSKPFKFFDSNDQDVEDPLSLPSVTASTFPHRFRQWEMQDEEPSAEDEFIPPPHVFSVSTSYTGNFFFTADDPRLEEGKRYLTMTDEEMAASLIEWKRTRPQIAADFKKLKKQANRKRTYSERKT